VDVVDRAGCHKWFGCILSGNNKGSHRADREYHSQAASGFFANRKNLQQGRVLQETLALFLTKLLLLLHVSPLATKRFTKAIRTL